MAMFSIQTTARRADLAVGTTGGIVIKAAW